MLFRFLLKIQQEVGFRLFAVEETELIVYDRLLPAATYYLGTYQYRVVVFTLIFVARICEYVESQVLTTRHLHCSWIAYRRVVVEVQRQAVVLYRTLAQADF